MSLNKSCLYLKDAYLPFVPHYKQDQLYLLQITPLLTLKDEKIIKEIIESPIQLKIKLSTQIKYEGGRPLILMCDVNRCHGYSIRHDFSVGWQITNDANTEYYNIRDQPHNKRILVGATELNVIYVKHALVSLGKSIRK